MSRIEQSLVALVLFPFMALFAYPVAIYKGARIILRKDTFIFEVND